MNLRHSASASLLIFRLFDSADRISIRVFLKDLFCDWIDIDFLQVFFALIAAQELIESFHVLQSYAENVSVFLA